MDNHEVERLADNTNKVMEEVLKKQHKKQSREECTLIKLLNNHLPKDKTQKIMQDIYINMFKTNSNAIYMKWNKEGDFLDITLQEDFDECE